MMYYNCQQYMTVVVVICVTHCPHEVSVPNERLLFVVLFLMDPNPRERTTKNPER